jgi:hypothetical protein
VLVGSCVLLEIEQLSRLKYCYISNMCVIQKGVLHQVKKVPQARCASIENCEEIVSVCESKEKLRDFSLAVRHTQRDLGFPLENLLIVNS